jgi:hypothetical protein
MLSEDKKPYRRYYSRHQVLAVEIAGAVFFFILVSGLFASSYLGIKILILVSLLAMLGMGSRIIRSGIETFHWGVRVRNVFSTFALQWEEIALLEIGRAGLFPMVCLINLKSGERKCAFGIQERTNFPDGSAAALVDELNAELAKRTRDESTPSHAAVDSH